jgi:hypothetical protein
MKPNGVSHKLCPDGWKVELRSSFRLKEEKSIVTLGTIKIK